MELKEKVKNLPSCPGVYLMRDSLENIIYVGKSKNLRNRVSSYFQNSKSFSPKVIKLIKNLKDFEYMITDTEFEAFLLECKLIKEYKPAYNRLMKSPKSYSYIKVTTDEKYPSIEISVDFSSNDGNTYFGPYSNKNTAEKGLNNIKDFYNILCNSNYKKNSYCIRHSLSLCIGMCLNNNSRAQYLDILNKIINLLKGNDTSILENMKYKMNCSSDKFDFENAAKYRDYIDSVNYLLSAGKIVNFTKKNKNIALLEHLGNNNFKFFLIQGNKILFKEIYSKNNFDLNSLKTILGTNILLYFNNENVDNSIVIEKEKIDESQIIYSYLKNKSNNSKHIVIPKKWLNSLQYSVLINHSLNELLTDF